MDMATGEIAEGAAEVDQQVGNRYQHPSWPKTLSAGIEPFSKSVRYAIYTITSNIRRPFGKGRRSNIPLIAPVESFPDQTHLGGWKSGESVPPTTEHFSCATSGIVYFTSMRYTLPCPQLPPHLHDSRIDLLLSFYFIQGQFLETWLV